MNVTKQNSTNKKNRKIKKSGKTSFPLIKFLCKDAGNKIIKLDAVSAFGRPQRVLSHRRSSQQQQLTSSCV